MKAKTIAEIVIAVGVGVGIYFLYKYLSGSNILGGLAGALGGLGTDLIGNGSQVNNNITKSADTFPGSYYSFPGQNPSQPSTTPTKRALGPNGQALLNSIQSAPVSLGQTDTYDYNGDYLGNNPILNQSVSNYTADNISSLTQSGSTINSSGIGVTNADLFTAMGAYAKSKATNNKVNRGVLGVPTWVSLPTSQVSGLSTASELLSPLSSKLPAGIADTALGSGYITGKSFNGTTEVSVPTYNFDFPVNIAGNANKYDSAFTAYSKKIALEEGAGKITNEQGAQMIGAKLNYINKAYNASHTIVGKGVSLVDNTAGDIWNSLTHI